MHKNNTSTRAHKHPAEEHSTDSAGAHLNDEKIEKLVSSIVKKELEDLRNFVRVEVNKALDAKDPAKQERGLI